MTDASITNPGEVTGRSASARLVGIDIARFIAIAGMIVTHTVGPLGSDPIERWAAGNASTLFAVLAGASVVLSTRRHLDLGHVEAARIALVARGLILIALGLVLGLSPSGIVVILVYLGVSLCIAAAFLRMRTVILVVIASVLAVAVAPLNLLARQGLDVVQELGSASIFDLIDNPLAFVRGVFLTGSYPVLTWIVFVIAGMLLARGLLAAIAAGRERRAAWNLTLAGTAVAVAAITTANLVYALGLRSAMLANIGDSQFPTDFNMDQILRASGFGAPSGYYGLFLDSPHSGTLLDILRGVGVSAAVIGVCLLVFSTRSTRTPMLIRPFAAAGAAPLTSYVLHVLSYTALSLSSQATGDTGWLLGWSAAALQIGTILLLGILLAALRRRGPLETLTSGVARHAGQHVIRRREART